MNLKVKHKASNALLSDLFAFCHNSLLPSDNILPGSWKEAKRMLKSIGMEYQIVHACINDCMLFRGADSNKDICDHCS